MLGGTGRTGTGHTFSVRKVYNDACTLHINTDCSRPLGSLVSTSTNSLKLSEKMKLCCMDHGPPADHLMLLSLYHEPSSLTRSPLAGNVTKQDKSYGENFERNTATISFQFKLVVV